MNPKVAVAAGSFWAVNMAPVVLTNYQNPALIAVMGGLSAALTKMTIGGGRNEPVRVFNKAVEKAAYSSLQMTSNGNRALRIAMACCYFYMGVSYALRMQRESKAAAGQGQPRAGWFYAGQLWSSSLVFACGLAGMIYAQTGSLGQ